MNTIKPIAPGALATRPSQIQVLNADRIKRELGQGLGWRGTEGARSLRLVFLPDAVGEYHLTDVYRSGWESILTLDQAFHVQIDLREPLTKDKRPAVAGFELFAFHGAKKLAHGMATIVHQFQNEWNAPPSDLVAKPKKDETAASAQGFAQRTETAGDDDIRRVLSGPATIDKIPRYFGDTPPWHTDDADDFIWLEGVPYFRPFKEQNKVVMGRKGLLDLHDVDVNFQDRSISRRHAEFIRLGSGSDSRWCLKPLDGQVVVNGDVLGSEGCFLNPGDIIAFPASDRRTWVDRLLMRKAPIDVIFAFAPER